MEYGEVEWSGRRHGEEVGLQSMVFTARDERDECRLSKTLSFLLSSFARMVPLNVSLNSRVSVGWTECDMFFTHLCYRIKLAYPFGAYVYFASTEM